jgi:methanethiol S-methyltransferase
MIFSALWTFYFVGHSLLASIAVKRWVENHCPSLYRRYRIAYNIIALTSFFALFALQQSMPDTVIMILPGVMNWVGIGLAANGILIILMTFNSYSIRTFTGLQSGETQEKEKALNTAGLNSRVRHPIYFGTLIALLGYLFYSFTFNTLIFVIIAIVYLFVGSILKSESCFVLTERLTLNIRKKCRA